MRKIEGISKTNHDILIIDHAGSEWLKYCIPKGCDQYTLKIRNVAPFVKSFSFFYNLAKCIIKSGVNSTSLLSAIVLELNPKVIITFIDNNRFMGKLQTVFPDILVISVQNGSRREYGDPCFDAHKEYYSFPHYFGFGKHESDIMKKRGCSVKKYYSVGSLKLGIFLSKFYDNQIQNNQGKSICLVSQYILSFTELSDIKSIKYMASLRKACRILAFFSKDNNIRVNIAMRNELDSEGYQKELNFFKEFFDCCDVIFYTNEHKKMSSYQIGVDSDVIIAFHSTLIYELFGMGKRVLLYGKVDQDLVDMLGCKSRFNIMPNECLLNSWNYGEFEKKVNSLMEMGDNEFLNKTEDARKYYMDFGASYPHDVISNYISNFLEKNKI